MSEMKMGVPQTPKDQAQEERPEHFKGDLAWSKEREQRMNETMHKVHEESLKGNGRATEETMGELRALVKETISAVRNNPEARAGVGIVEQSRLLQMLLLRWYWTTTDSTIETSEDGGWQIKE